MAIRVATIVDVPLDGDREPTRPRRWTGLPRRAPALTRRSPARLARVGPPGHALGRDTPASRGDRCEDGTIGASDLAAGGPEESIVQPEWSPDGVAPPRQRPERLVEPLPRARRAATRAARSDGRGVRGPGLDLRPLVVRVPHRRLDRRVGPVRWARPARPRRCRASTSGEVETPFTELDGLRIGAASRRRPRRVARRGDHARHVRSRRRSPRPGVLRRATLARDRPGGHLAPRDRSRSRSTDDREAHALYYRPANAAFVGPDDERPPLVVLSHGGPTSNASSALDLGSSC